MLCQTFHLNPLADGVIISHKEGHSRGVASNHGDQSICGISFRWDIQWMVSEKRSKAAMGGSDTTAGLQASVFANLSETEVIAKVGALFI